MTIISLCFVVLVTLVLSGHSSLFFIHTLPLTVIHSFRKQQYLPYFIILQQCICVNMDLYTCYMCIVICGSHGLHGPLCVHCYLWITWSAWTFMCALLSVDHMVYMDLYMYIAVCGAHGLHGPLYVHCSLWITWSTWIYIFPLPSVGHLFNNNMFLPVILVCQQCK